MNSHYITAETLLAKFPDVLAKDERMYALASLVADFLNTQVESVDSVRIYPRIDELPEDLLDILAKDLKVDWYNEEYPLQVKRNLIKSSFKVHRTLGSKGAVKEALSALYPGSSVYEWFEYGGDPYYFKVILDVTSQYFEVSHDDVIKTLDIYKSLRSRIDGNEIIYRSTEGVILKTSAKYLKYELPVCGTDPQTAVQGSISSPGVRLGTAVSSLGIDAEFCGASLDSLM